MKIEEFNVILDNFLSDMKTMLTAKQQEYAIRGDRLSQFKSIAALRRCSTGKALWGAVSKQITSLSDCMEGHLSLTPEQLQDKIMDVANYMALLYAVCYGDGLLPRQTMARLSSDMKVSGEWQDIHIPPSIT